MNLIKKIIILSLILISSNLCYAAQQADLHIGTDYLITTDENVTSTLVANPNIITLSPFFTIFNEKNVYLMHPEKLGKTIATINIGAKNYTFCFVIKPQTNKPDELLIETDGLEIMPLDTPPEFPSTPENKNNKDEKGAD